MKSITTPYRPDIDGLRAVAVLSVLFYHAGISVFTGGWVGVDVFFVISGFLITRLLISEIEKNGQIDFSSFYLRRVRRLLPAFTFTVIWSSVFAIWMLSPAELMNYGATLLHAVLSISNVYFYTQSGYFDTALSLNPLLHTWSLGVEEQFYLVWPFLLILASRRKWLAHFLISIGLISLYLAQKQVAAHAAGVFFLMPFRIFEFSIGASLVWLTRTGIQFKSQTHKEPLLWIGLVLVAYSVFNYSGQTLFPGVSALVPCIGAALCIYSGDAKITGKILNNRLFVGIGLISYSLYLAHWPVIVFFKHHMGNTELNNLESSMVIVVSFAIALFMYFYIEKPYRSSEGPSRGFLCGCAMLMLLGYVGASMWATDGWNWRKWASTGSIHFETFKTGQESRFQTRQRICLNKGWDACDDLVPGKVNALILGDSHAVDALNAFERIYPNHNYSMSTLGGCPPYRNIENITSANHPDRLKCSELNEARFDPRYLRKFDYIVINVKFGWYTPEHLYEYLEYLKENNVQKVIVFGDYLTLKREMHELLNQYGYSELEVRNNLENTLVDESALKSRVSGAGYFFLSKREMLCQDNNCKLFDANRVPFTYDKHHLSYEFAARLALNQIGKINQYLELDGGGMSEAGLTNTPASSGAAEFVVENWGPQFTKAGVVPNIQPAGEMGIWISISEMQGLGNLEVLFDGKSASITVVQKKLITAAIPPVMLAKPGRYDVVVKQDITNKLFPVGVFEIQPSK